MLLLWSGFASTVLVTILALGARWAGLTTLDPIRLCASVFRPVRNGGAAGRAAGLLALLALGAAVIPAFYLLAFALFERADAWTGLGLGIVHGLAAGPALALLPRPAGAVAPGLYGWRAGRLTPALFVILHALYGAALGYLYVLA
jgi:hypothetical protein